MDWLVIFNQVNLSWVILLQKVRELRSFTIYIYFICMIVPFLLKNVNNLYTDRFRP